MPVTRVTLEVTHPAGFTAPAGWFAMRARRRLSGPLFRSTFLVNPDTWQGELQAASEGLEVWARPSNASIPTPFGVAGVAGPARFETITTQLESAITRFNRVVDGKLAEVATRLEHASQRPGDTPGLGR